MQVNIERCVEVEVCLPVWCFKEIEEQVGVLNDEDEHIDRFSALDY